MPTTSPTPFAAPQPRIVHFQHWVEQRLGRRFACYDDFWRWSVDDSHGFWAALWDYFELQSPTPWRTVLEAPVMPGAMWFPGAQVNFAQQVFRHAAAAHAAGHPALVFQDEDMAAAGQPPQTLSWPELQRQAAAFAARLRAAGIVAGDRVVAFLPNTPHAIVAFLGTASVGALWSVCSPDMGPVAVLDRFRQIAPRVLVAVDGQRWGQVVHDRRDVLREVLAQPPTAPFCDGGRGLQGVPAVVRALQSAVFAPTTARCCHRKLQETTMPHVPTQPLRLLAAAALLGAVALPAAAQQNIEKLKQMKVATTDLNIPVVPQTGRNADAIRDNLKRIKLPPGFRIDLFAVVPDARHMAVAPSTNMLFVGTRKTSVWAVTDRNSDGVADEVKSFAPSLKFTNPNGVCWTKDGFLIVAEHNRVLNFPAAEFFYEGPDVAVIEVVPQGKLVPPEEESYNHGARTCRVGDDGKLHVTLGQPFNVQPKEKVALYEQLGIGGMIRMNAFDGSGREVLARGVRNSVGMDINPKDKTVA